MIFIDACFKKDTEYTPIWIMRQAGRYLKEYQDVRSRAGDFLSLCKDYKLSSEVTLQPVDILDVDAAILFSDILVIPLEMGMKLKFVKNEGPVFEDPIHDLEDIKSLKEDKLRLDYVYDCIKLTRDKLNKNKALIGFCGAPWTLATYMIEGGSSKSYSKCKKMLYSNPELLHKLLSKITFALKEYLQNQIKSGVNAIQIFDSWASALDEQSYLEFGLKYINEIVDYIKQKYPHIAVIVFSKSINGFLEKIDGNFDVFGVDWGISMKKARDELKYKFTLQGNMDPARLYDKNSIKIGVDKIISEMKGHPHIFNLGHGIFPDVSVENVKFFVDYVKSASRK